MLVATKLLSRQNYVCRDKYLTNTCLSRQKRYLRQFPPMILVDVLVVRHAHGPVAMFLCDVCCVFLPSPLPPSPPPPPTPLVSLPPPSAPPPPVGKDTLNSDSHCSARAILTVWRQSVCLSCVLVSLPALHQSPRFRQQQDMFDSSSSWTCSLFQPAVF